MGRHIPSALAAALEAGFGSTGVASAAALLALASACSSPDSRQEQQVSDGGSELAFDAGEGRAETGDAQFGEPDSSEAAIDSAAEERARVFRALVDEVVRLDATALEVRARDPERTAFHQIAAGLEQEARGAADARSLARVYRRLDAAYTSMHAWSEPGGSLAAATPPSLRGACSFAAEWLSGHQTGFRVDRVDADFPGDAADAPAPGDGVVAINGRPMVDWSRENADFCKRSVREACDLDLSRNLMSELLSWTRDEPLVLTLSRGPKTWTVTVPLVEADDPGGWDSSAYACKNQPGRFPDFEMVHAGNRVCVYESALRPGTAIMRIASFDYHGTPGTDSIQSVADEAAAIAPWWQSHATWDLLVVDVIDNPGGEAFIDLLRLIADSPFEGEYIELRKSRELDDPTLRNKLFWGDSAHENWFQNLVESGVHAAIAYGEFLPAVPMFCADPAACASGSFQPAKHPFKGRVIALVNSDCVSSCDGFVWALHRTLGNRARLVGQPAAADSAWARAVIDVAPQTGSPDSTTFVRTLFDAPSQGRLASQGVILSRPLTSSGSLLNGRPDAMDRFVPLTLENRGAWPQAALQAAFELADQNAQ